MLDVLLIGLLLLVLLFSYQRWGQEENNLFSAATIKYTLWLVVAIVSFVWLLPPLIEFISLLWDFYTNLLKEMT